MASGLSRLGVVLNTAVYPEAAGAADSPFEEEAPGVKSGGDLGTPGSVTAPFSCATTDGLTGAVSVFENVAFRNSSTFTKYLRRLLNSLRFSFNPSSNDALSTAARR